MKNVLNVTEIKNIIPHRYPFLLVDKVEIIEEGMKGIGYKNITINEYFFQGHFPEYPVMPGVLIIEAMAQTGAVVILSQENFKGKTPFLAGLNKVKFRKKVVPGDTLLMTVEISKLRGAIGVGKGKAEVDGQIVCEAEFLFAIG
ncbi:3-hydroxyacyl-ACP dehydratase FabZ [Sporanaerobacter sp. PP17-6a]|uniref:3-hydroxyacyl-ACP dehydratase FabZ n=1 Tax=Sporanaerobacter sp. PP17-6a TaxID=1891289 RepID=UPI0008A0094D|nr:3-hydroxyacyl-ACP dehydratase FabZ [Sporanaerobacter sp. PP17-6a]SCL94179.1 3-hydroxyacyl-[acyl-carrier-protein] dehydratase FabZ [Sporanaerobacter sp. PP17-6a]